MSKNVNYHYDDSRNVHQKVVSEVVLYYIFVSPQSPASNFHTDSDPDEHYIYQKHHKNDSLLPVWKYGVYFVVISYSENDYREHVFHKDYHYSKINNQIPP